jgi:hypothetical protein
MTRLRANWNSYKGHETLREESMTARVCECRMHRAAHVVAWSSWAHRGTLDGRASHFGLPAEAFEEGLAVVPEGQRQSGSGRVVARDVGVPLPHPRVRVEERAPVVVLPCGTGRRSPPSWRCGRPPEMGNHVLERDPQRAQPRWPCRSAGAGHGRGASQFHNHLMQAEVCKVTFEVVPWSNGWKFSQFDEFTVQHPTVFNRPHYIVDLV